jgi:hypothetical protein
LTGAAQAASVEYPTVLQRDYLFAWTATATGSSGAVTVNFAGGTNANPTVVDVIQLSGNDTVNPVVQSPTAIGLVGSATATLSGPDTSNGEIVVASYLANASLTTPSGFTALDTFKTGSNGGENYGVYFNASAQSVTSVTSGGLGLGWGTIGLELKHA